MKRYANSNEVWWGTEPDPKSCPHPLDPKFNIFLADALNWYNYSATSEKKKGWFMKWLAANRPSANSSAIEVMHEGAFTTAGTIARLYMRGVTESSYLNSKLDAWVSEYEAKGLRILKEKEKKNSIKKIDVSLSKDPQTIYLCGLINGVIDDFILSGYKKTKFDMSDWVLSNNPTASQLAVIRDAWFPLLEELLNESEDEDLAEAYSHLTDKQVENFVEILLDIVTSKKVRKARTVRKAKAKSPDKITKRVKFAPLDPETGVKSIEPKSIPGSTSVLVWNKKYRMLGLYVAEGNKELSVKGSSIINYDPETSVWKKVRKPNEIVPKSVTSTKAQVKKLIDSLSSKESKMNGRLNAETIILKVY